MPSPEPHFDPLIGNRDFAIQIWYQWVLKMIGLTISELEPESLDEFAVRIQVKPSAIARF